MDADRTYKSPQAFRAALTQRLRTEAQASDWSLPELQRQFAYDRLLERLYKVDEGWIIKGAAALLARRLSLRSTIDVDVYRQATTDTAEADFRAAAGVDLRDWFQFQVGRSLPLTGGGVGLSVVAYVGQTEWERFKVDLVGSDFRMTGQPEAVPPLANIHIPMSSSMATGRIRSSIMLPTNLPPPLSGTARQSPVKPIQGPDRSRRYLQGRVPPSGRSESRP